MEEHEEAAEPFVSLAPTGGWKLVLAASP